MGIGTCSLGYSNKVANKAVKKSIDNGSFSTLNSFEEVKLVEKLISLHPFMDMVRFTRSGGDKLYGKRIARAASRKSKVAVCGYHGWHDWYMAANLTKNGLNGLLMSGLEPSGVPKELENTTFPFHYGNIDELNRITSENNDIGVICIEVQRGNTIDVDL